MGVSWEGGGGGGGGGGHSPPRHACIDQAPEHFPTNKNFDVIK